MPELQKITMFADFLRTLENGAIHARLTDALKELAGALENHAADNAGKASGRIKLDIKFKLEGGVFEITAEETVALPKEKPARTILWGTPDNFFTVSNPRQVELFGPREVIDPGTGEIRSVS